MDWGKIAQVGVSILGSLKGKKAEGKAGDAYAAALDLLQKVTPPSLADLTVELSKYVQQGEITPEEYVAYLQEKSAAEGIEIPQEILDIQHETLSQLSDIVNDKGLTPMDRAQMNNVMDQVSAKVRGQNKATQQEFAQRGMSGSGLEAAQRLSTDSAATEAAAKGGYDIAAEAQKRALDALTKRGDYATQMNSQSFNQQKSKADAMDAINRFNTDAKQAVSDKNVAASNAAQAANLGQRQQIANQNTDIANKNASNVAAARQQQFSNSVSMANPQANQLNAMGDNAIEKGARDENVYAGIANGLGSIFGKDDEEKKKTVVSDKNEKIDIKDLSDEQVDDILDQLTGKQFKYAKKYGDDRPRVGIVAQDLEKTEPGASLVSEDNGVKVVDGPQAAMMALGLIANQHRRIKKMEGK